MKHIIVIIYILCNINTQAQVIKNRNFVNWVKYNGERIAPAYPKEDVVGKNCVEFMYASLREFYNISLTEKQLHQFFISDYTFENIEKDLKKGIINKKLKGLQTVLIEEGGFAITEKNVKIGDFVQFWETENVEVIWGHCGVISEILEDGFVIYGSQPTNDNNFDGIDEDLNGGFGRMFIGKPKIAFYVRYKNDTY